MAGYNQHGNSHSFAGLNGLPQDYEMALQQQRAHHGGQYDFQADLDMFTNTQFFDFDMAEMPVENSPHDSSTEGDMWAMSGPQFMPGDQTNVGGFSTYNHRQHAPQPSFYQPHRSTTATTTSTPSNVTPPNGTTNAVKHRQQPSAASLDAGRSDKALAALSQDAQPTNLDEASRMAAEEDKRRRNTAASARFRVKKKQREQALEKSAKAMTDRVRDLEQRVMNLELENKLLKDLITERDGTSVTLPHVRDGKVIEGGVVADEVDDVVSVSRGKAHAEDNSRRKEVKIEMKAAS